MEASVRSHRSKQSTLTSVRRRLNSQINKDTSDVQPIAEKDENENGEDPMPTQMFDAQGNPIELSAEQLNLIETLNRQKQDAKITEEQQKALQSINLEDL